MKQIARVVALIGACSVLLGVAHGQVTVCGNIRAIYSPPSGTTIIASCVNGNPHIFVQSIGGNQDHVIVVEPLVANRDLPQWVMTS